MFNSLAPAYPEYANVPVYTALAQPDKGTGRHRRPILRKFRNICLLSHNEARGQHGHWGRRRGMSKYATAGGPAKGETRFCVGGGV